MKKRLREHLLSKWYLYLIWAVAIVLLWGWIFGLITRPSKDEKLVIFVGAYSCEYAALESELSKDKEEYLREIEVNYFSVSDYNFYMFLTVKSPDTDIFILPESVVNEIGEERFLPFEGGAATEAFDGAKLLEINGAFYGVMVNAAGGEGCAKDFVGYSKDGESENYYLLFNRNSPHTGGLSAAKLSGAITAAARFLSL